MEDLIHSILLALHNIALVGCAAAPFYNRNLVVNRSQFGAKLSYKLDKVVEDTLQGNAPFCIAFIITLFITGMGIPFNYFYFHGAFRELSMVAGIALTVKLAAIFGMVIIMVIIFFKINPELTKLFAGFSENEDPKIDSEKLFFKLRARRKKLCEICLKFAIVVLVASAFIGYGH